MLIPKNTKYNRELNLLDCSGSILKKKNGIAYFYIVMASGEKQYFMCDENFLGKQFEGDLNETEEFTTPANELELVIRNCKKYPK